MIKIYLYKGYHNLFYILLVCMFTGCIPEDIELPTIVSGVDIGLSVEWASCNVGADSPEDYGSYFAWGETKTKSSYTPENSVTYGLSTSELVSRGIIGPDGNLTAGYDAATANWSSGWRMPTEDEIKELMNDCTWEWITMNGVSGYKVIGPNGNSIFLPAAGARSTSLYDAAFYGHYLSATPYSDSRCVSNLYFYSGVYGSHPYFSRDDGCSVRPVRGRSKVSATGDAIDLGLSVKWASCNVGADSPEDYGSYFAWGETKTKSSYTPENSVTYGLSTSELVSRGIIGPDGNLTAGYDAATANWSSGWRMPTLDEMKELVDECTWEWTTMNGVNGRKVTGPNGNSIFLPAAGCRYDTSLSNAGSYGYYWSGTLYENYSNYAYYLYFDSGNHYWYSNLRFSGYTVRPVTDK